MPPKKTVSTSIAQLYSRVRGILESARAGVARTVNTTQVVANWLIGREIIEEQQRGEKRAGYGERLMRDLASTLHQEFGGGYGLANLKLYRQFYLAYPQLTEMQKGYAVRSLFTKDVQTGDSSKGYASRSQSLQEGNIVDAPPQISPPAGTSDSWRSGLLNPNLSWTHYRTLLKVDNPDARSFYEIEAIQNAWSARELERQINSLLYERLALSRDKQGVMRLAKKGQEIQQPLDVFKDPVVIEFLGLPESPRLVESNLEQALINKLQAFLLELGKGFAFVARQERITLDGDHFYIDLVFYHTVLKCFVLVELKTKKLTHGDLGQLQFYVNYYDRERRTPGDQPTIGLILCTDKNDAVVKYTLSEGPRIFASRYKLHLPSEAELRDEMRREIKNLRQ